jgi:hypothetical protein
MKLSEQPVGGTWVYPEVERVQGRNRVVLAIVRGAADDSEPLWSEVVDARLLDTDGRSFDQLDRPRAAILDEVGGPSLTSTAVFEFADALSPPRRLVVELNGDVAAWQLPAAGGRPFWRGLFRALQARR